MSLGGIDLPVHSPRRPRDPNFQRHVRAHEAIISNEHWYGDGKPSLGERFSAEKTAERQNILINILVKFAKQQARAGNDGLARSCTNLAHKLENCHPRRRCGSLACPLCARAFQKAKVAAQQVLIRNLQRKRSSKKLVMANVVALHLKFTPDQLPTLDIQKRNRWLKDSLRRASFNRVMFGSADLSWENGFYQLHWHIGMWTSNPTRLTERLKEIFPGEKAYDRPVVVSETWSLGFLPYKDKGIKLPDLLRRNRTYLPQLMLVLDRTEPLDSMVLCKLRLSAQDGGLSLRQIRRSKAKRSG